MRTTTGTWRIRLVTSVLVVVIAGCGGDDDGTQVETPVPTTVQISPESAMLTSINATQGFTAVVRDQDGKAMPSASVSWSSSDAAIFTVSANGSNATVEAVGNGDGTLTATSGQASGTASVEVAQVPTRLEMVSGNEQEGLRGTVLPEGLVVRLEDQGGTVVEGASVTFLPDQGHGSVSETMVETDADGMASTEWTLGIDDRMQSLVAFSGDASGRFRATATADPPIPDYAIAGELEPSRFDPLDTDTIEIGVPITNLGDGPGPATFKVRLTLGSTVLQTLEVDQIEPGETATATFTAGPFEVGTRRITAEIDSEEEVEEWEDGNNTGDAILTVKTQRTIALGESVTVESNFTGPVFLFRIDIAEASDEALNVELSGGTGDADLFGHFGDRPDHHYKYRCFSGNQDANELCQMVPTRVGTYHIAVHAFSAFGPSSLKVTVGGKPLEPYDIDLVFVAGGTESQNNIIRQAAERWESVIARDVFERLIFLEGPLGSNHCGPGSAVTEDIDDMIVFVNVDSIDGSGNAVARSQPCAVASYPFTGATSFLQPRTGSVALDRDDIARLESDGVLLSVVTHQFAHALGFHPRIWNMREQLRNPSLPDSPGADTHFAGPVAIAAFDAAGGGDYGGGKVPVENGAVPGSSDNHWRAGVFGDELMTPVLTGSEQPLSLITLDALYDIWYEIDPGAADAFTLAGTGAAGLAMPRGVVVDLGNDIGWAYPITVSRPLSKRRK